MNPLGGGAVRCCAVALLLAATSLVIPPAAADRGGPDAYGYVWVDSRAPSPVVPFSWVEITTTGTRVALAADDCTFELSMGFQFRFYGVLVDQVHVCSNGFVTFSVQGFGPDPPIPSPAAPNDRIVALGMDLYPSIVGSAGVYVLSQSTASPRRFVVTWNSVNTQYTTDLQTFQIVLEQNNTSRDGRILIQYQTLTNATSALVGIENRTGSSGLVYPLAPSDGLAVAFLPPSDAGLPPDTLSVVPVVLAPGTTAQGNRDVPMMQLDLSTPSNDVLVSEIKVELSGLDAGPEDIPLAALWLDDGDGGFSTATDSLLRTAIMTGSPTTARFAIVPSLRVTLSAARRVYVSYDIAPGAGVGDWVGARMAASSFVSVEFPDGVAASGFPAESYTPGGRTRIDASVDTLSLLTTSDLVPANGTQWETDVPVVNLRFVAGSNLVDLAGLTFEIGGNATAGDVWRVKAIEDKDRDSSYTPGVDTVLAVATPSGVPLAANLTFSRSIPAGAPVGFLILFDVGPEGVVGNVANFTLNGSGIHLAPGSVDLLSFSNLPVTTGNVTTRPGIRPALLSAWSAGPPSADASWNVGEYVLGPPNTAILDPPAGNRIGGYITVENNATMLFAAIDATGDLTSSPEDGVAIGFDTDGDGLPTNATDDVFVANATGGARLLYNDTAGAWVWKAPCDAIGGSDATPACAAGFGATELSDTAHRFYEFAIPLALLGVAVPVAPGTILRFAMAAPPHDGLASQAGRSTWPILFDPLPSLRFFADLDLAAAPPPNTPPTLNWTGEPGYTADGLEPEAGFRDDVFSWRVVYADPDDDPPAFAQPRIHVLREGVPIPGSPFAMAEDDPADTRFQDGKLYVEAVRLAVCGGNFTYVFTARDGVGGTALPVSGPGPTVLCPDLPPTLLFPQVSPPSGLSGIAFTYRIAYADPEGRPATYVETTVALDGSDMQTFPLSLSGWVGTPGDYAEGAWYDGSAILLLQGTNYTYRFRTSDGNTITDAGPFLGPEVLPQPPDVLRALGGDLAPLVVDEGARLVEFLQLILYTSDAGINVTSVRFDRTGSSTDSEVQEVLLYDDRDTSGRRSPGDILLGSSMLLLGFAEFSVSLRVTPSNATYLLLLANLTTPGTADATVGFELSAAASIGVDPGDAVEPFAPMRSTRTIVNVRPRAAGLTVDGWAPGTAQITHITVDAPRITWRFEDNNSADLQQRAYNVSVWSVSPLMPVWSRNESTGASSTAYAGPSLEPGQTYRAQVLVHDGRLWSAPWVATFRRNTPLAAPALLDPVDLAANVPTAAILKWETLSDPEGDSIRYFSWVSPNPGFSPAFANVSFSASVTLVLVGSTEYFWKVGASDGYEFTSGNATVWRFTTVSPTAPVLGDVRGRVINGTSLSSLAGALVELLNGTQVEDGMVTGADGLFVFEDLALGPYTVRVSAFGFVSQTRPAAPTRPSPSVDLGDIVLAATGGTGVEDGAVTLPWLPLVLLLVMALSVFLVFVLRRRSRREDPSAFTNPPGAEDAPVGVEEPAESADPSAMLPAGNPPAVAATTVVGVFDCSVCGRPVPQDADRCACGASFDA